MNEIEKMRSGLLADFSAPEVQDSFRHCKKLLAKFRTMSTYDDDYRTVLEDLIPGIPETSVIMPPFHCDHGHGIRLGEHVFVNAGCTFLDGAYITIGDYTLIALTYKYTLRIILSIIVSVVLRKSIHIRLRLVRIAG